MEFLNLTSERSRASRRLRHKQTLAIAAAILLATPSTALAHVVTSGFSTFYDGVLHLLSSPGDLLGLAAAALLAGSRGETASRLAAIVVPTAWLVSGLVGLNLPAAVDLPSLGLILPAIVGVLVAADVKLRPVAVAMLIGLFAAFHGLLNGAALAANGAGVSSLFGTVVAVLIFFLLLSAAVVRLQSVRGRGIVRLIGGSVTAAGLLELGWLAQGSH